MRAQMCGDKITAHGSEKGGGAGGTRVWERGMGGGWLEECQHLQDCVAMCCSVL